MKQLDEQGVSIFEISIIILILIFVGMSCYLVMSNINNSAHTNYNKTRTIPSDGK
ncbi:MAG: hypothetical protein ACQR33_02390 [Candidatus Saccharibacteria bacterium]